jgi:S-phase kinase-associated protein 1
MERLVTLVSSDGETFHVTDAVAQKSQLLQAVLEEEDNAEEVPLPKVSSAILRLILEVIQHSLTEPLPTIPKPLPTTKLESIIPAWYATFMAALPTETVFNLTEAADYMHVESVLELCCATLAATIKDKSVEELRAFFKITPDLSAEDEAAIQAQSSWTER